VIFVDDYSQFNWIYPLRTKSETYKTFVKFKLLVENTFTTHIKHLQSDGGGEFTSSQFQNFLTNHGIVHRKSCPYTSPQNGIVERKLRHILETELTLIAHAHLSNKYWPDAFLTTVHTINRLPIATLHHSSAYEKLYNKSSDYHRLRVFGCLCYPLLRPYGLHKLDFKSKPYIFLGYQYAGYKCLDPVTSKVYLSHHVVFDETHFPAKDHGVALLPSQLLAIGEVTIPFPIISHVSDVPFMPPTVLSLASLTKPNPASSSGPTPPVFLQECASPSLSNSLAEPSIPDPPASPSLPSSPIAASLELEFSVAPIPASLEPTFPAAPTISPYLPTHPMITRSQTGHLHPKQFPDFQTFHTKYPLLSYHTTAP
jgi:hypothetical protein